MPIVQYRPASPYAKTRQTNWYLDLYEPRLIQPDATDVEMFVDAPFHCRPDLFSVHLYGTPDYWWVFIVRNPNLMTDPIWDLRTGMALMIPTKDRIENS